MKKILFICDGKNYPEGLISMARWWNEREPILLTGVFLSLTDYSRLAAASTNLDGVLVSPLVYQLTEDDEKVAAEQISRFSTECLKHHIEFRVHDDVVYRSLEELLKETRYADLMLLSDTLFYGDLFGEQPNEYMREVLRKSDCPVLLVPETFPEITRTVLTYDGSIGSMHAIRQFAYLFSEVLKDAETELIHLKEGAPEDLPEANRLEEYLGRHFPKLTLHSFSEQDQFDLSQFLEQRPGAIVVSGAFSRSGFSMLLKGSFIMPVLRQHQFPIFLSHCRK